MKTETALDSIMKPVAYFVLAVPFAIALIAAIYVWSGYVLSVMWGWFIVPTFGLPALSIPTAIGVAMVAGMLAKQYIPNKDDGWKSLSRPFIGPAVTFLAGWIVTRFL